MSEAPDHILWDLDGTLADNSHRTGLAKQKRWDEYHEACDKDEPLHGALALLELLSRAYDAEMGVYKVTIITGRSEAVRDKTVQWLQNHLGGWTFTHDELVMRAEGDFTPNVAFKRRYVQSLNANPEQILLIDDHPDAMDLSDVCRVLPIRSTW